MTLPTVLPCAVRTSTVLPISPTAWSAACMPSSCSTFSLCCRLISSELNCASCATNCLVVDRLEWILEAQLRQQDPQEILLADSGIARHGTARIRQRSDRIDRHVLTPPVASHGIADVRRQARQRLFVEPLLPRALGIPARLQLAALAQALHDRELFELLDDLVRAPPRSARAILRARPPPPSRSRRCSAANSRDAAAATRRDRLRRRELLAGERLRVVDAPPARGRAPILLLVGSPRQAGRAAACADSSSADRQRSRLSSCRRASRSFLSMLRLTL